MEESGKDPKALQNRPEIPEYLAFYVTSFFRLSERRTAGFSGVNPISFSDIYSYLQIYPCHDVDLFLFLLTEMDDQYLEIKNRSNG